MPKLAPPRTRPPKAALGKPTLEPCPTCHLLVLVRIAVQREYRWQDPESDKVKVMTVLGWQELDPPRDPLGVTPHDCTRAQARWALIERMQAGKVEVRPGTQGREWVDLATGEVIELGQE